MIVFMGEKSKLFLVTGSIVVIEYSSREEQKRERITRLVLAEDESEAKDKFEDEYTRSSYNSRTEVENVVVSGVIE